MTDLDERERRLALWAAGIAAATWMLLWALSGFTTTATVLAAVGLGLAGLLALAARHGNRLLTGLAAVVLSFGPWGRAYLLGLPYSLLAAWLLFRGIRATDRTRAGGTPTGRSRAGRTRAGRTSADPGADDPGADEPGADDAVDDEAMASDRADDEPVPEKRSRARRSRKRAARAERQPPGAPAGASRPKANKRYTPPRRGPGPSRAR